MASRLIRPFVTFGILFFSLINLGLVYFVVFLYPPEKYLKDSYPFLPTEKYIRPETIQLKENNRHLQIYLKELGYKIKNRSQKNISQQFTIRQNNQEKKVCPDVSPLLGWINIASILSDSWKENKVDTREIAVGGKYTPNECQSQEKVAIIVPFRNRKSHLKIFLRYMHPFLQRQQLEYMIFVVEQSEGSPFNRGMLMNIGYKEAKKYGKFKCFIFHDVDLLPEDDRNLYICPKDGKPRQLAFLMDIYDYSPAPETYFGGANAFSTGDFELINGFSNLFWGWGSEDDDLYQRVLHHNLTVTRMFEKDSPLFHVARYKMLDHDWVNPNPNRDVLLEKGTIRLKSDGLFDLLYFIPDVKFTTLYTHIFVDIQQGKS